MPLFPRSNKAWARDLFQGDSVRTVSVSELVSIYVPLPPETVRNWKRCPQIGRGTGNRNGNKLGGEKAEDLYPEEIEDRWAEGAQTLCPTGRLRKDILSELKNGRLFTDEEKTTTTADEVGRLMAFEVYPELEKIFKFAQVWERLFDKRYLQRDPFEKLKLHSKLDGLKQQRWADLVESALDRRAKTAKDAARRRKMPQMWFSLVQKKLRRDLELFQRALRNKKKEEQRVRTSKPNAKTAAIRDALEKKKADALEKKKADEQKKAEEERRKAVAALAKHQQQKKAKKKPPGGPQTAPLSSSCGPAEDAGPPPAPLSPSCAGGPDAGPSSSSCGPSGSAEPAQTPEPSDLPRKLDAADEAHHALSQQDHPFPASSSSSPATSGPPRPAEESFHRAEVEEFHRTELLTKLLWDKLPALAPTAVEGVFYLQVDDMQPLCEYGVISSVDSYPEGGSECTLVSSRWIRKADLDPICRSVDRVSEKGGSGSDEDHTATSALEAASATDVLAEHGARGGEDRSVSSPEEASDALGSATTLAKQDPVVVPPPSRGSGDYGSPALLGAPRGGGRVGASSARAPPPPQGGDEEQVLLAESRRACLPEEEMGMGARGGENRSRAPAQPYVIPARQIQGGNPLHSTLLGMRHQKDRRKVADRQARNGRGAHNSKSVFLRGESEGSCTRERRPASVGPLFNIRNRFFSNILQHNDDDHHVA